MLHIFGCPMHYGVGTKGIGLIHSLEYLSKHYEDLNMTILPEITESEEDLPNLKNFNSVISTCNEIADYSYNNILKNGETPLFIGGDHSSAMGTVSAASATYENLGLIWVDAHPDINTDATTATGNIHGMPVAALLGKGEPALTKILNDNVKLKPENVVMIGLRDIDPPEAITLKELNIKYFTYDEVKERGLEVCLDESIAHLSNVDHVHVSFDIDSVNPAILPGVSVPVEDGFTLPEVYRIFERYLSELPISSLDIVEFNAELDKEMVTSDFVLDLIQFIKEHIKKVC